MYRKSSHCHLSFRLLHGSQDCSFAGAIYQQLKNLVRMEEDICDIRPLPRAGWEAGKASLSFLHHLIKAPPYSRPD